MLDIINIDQHISQQGNFCLIDWLLSDNLLHYSSYESWRYGQLEYLDDSFLLENISLSELLVAAQTHCQSLGLQSQSHVFYRWGGQHHVGLVASKNDKYHQQLTQQWLRPQDLPQLDLFMDNTAIIVENALREALSGRRFDHAQQQLHRLIELNPEHLRLGGYQDMINYGLHMQDNEVIDEQAFKIELQGLQQEALPLAQEVLGGQARDYLAFAWRRLANNFNMLPFDSQEPELHRSFALAQIPDWLSIEQCLLDDNMLYQQPVLMERLATAYIALQQDGKGLLLWCLMIDLHPEYAEAAIERHRGQAVHQLWEDFWAYDDVWPSAFFTAFILASQPGLVHLVDSFIPLKLRASCAMVTLLRCYLAGENEIAAREGLQAVSPALLRMYMDIRKK